MGKGYWLCHDGTIIDVSSDFGGGTEDHVGFLASAYNPSLIRKFRLSKIDVAWLKDLYEEGNGSSEAFLVCKKIIDKGNIRIRIFQNTLYATVSVIDESSIKRVTDFMLTHHIDSKTIVFENIGMDQTREYDRSELITEAVEANDKVSFFKQRTDSHVNRVKENAKKIVEAYPEFKQLLSLAEKHDASKYLEPEYTPYLDLTWNKFKGIKDTDARTNEATLHHITSNPHHPEYWDKDKANLDPNDRDKSVECLDATRMPDICLAEMVADWQAMSQELNQGNCRAWYDKQKNVRWKFNEHQDQIIDKLIKVFETKQLEEAVMDMKVWYHGSASGELKGGTSGLHLGTYLAAKEALEATIGIPVEGEWDGTREYGKTLLCGRKTQLAKKIGGTGYNCSEALEEDFYPTQTKAPTYSNGESIPFTVKPSIKGYKILCPMNNTPQTAYADFKANGYMKSSLKKGNAKNGFYYKNISEDEGSISVVVPPNSIKLAEAIEEGLGKKLMAAALSTALVAGTPIQNADASVHHLHQHHGLAVHKYSESDYVKTIIGEASNQGYDGMLAIACAIRNRMKDSYYKNDPLNGAYGKNAEHIGSEPKEIWKLANQAWSESSTVDITNGAIIWGTLSDIAKFKSQGWFKNVVQTLHIKDHTFFKRIA